MHSCSKVKFLFVGDKPSDKNSDKEVPFVGTASYKVLLHWFEQMQIENWTLFNSHTEKELDLIRFFLNNHECRVVALGGLASDRLKKIGIKHFKLPHPSPRNRKNNDKELLTLELQKCKKYLEESC